jgi:hypothetical protein
MVDAPAIPTHISYSDKSDARMATPPVNGPETTPNQGGDWALDKRVYRTLARYYILEQQKRETRKKRVTSVYATVLSTAFFIAVIAIGYWGARRL